jgi:hypothetical protein
MSIEQFTIQTSTPDSIYNIITIFVVIGAILLLTWALLWSRFKHRPVFGGKIVGIGMGINSKYGLAILGIVLIVLGGFIYGVTVAATPSVVTIASGHINIESENFASHGVIFSISGNKNVTSEEIAVAFVDQVGSGDFKLHKNYGTNFGDTNIDKYTLGNGASAYIATTNATCLIIELKNGECVILGNQDTQTVADSFAQNVHPLSTP